MQSVSLRLNGKNESLVYSPNAHKFYLSGVPQTERVKMIKDICKIDEGLDDEFYIRQMIELGRPPQVGFNIITNRCNMNCSFCYAEANVDQDSVFKLSWIKSLKKSLPSECFGVTVFSGGEPFLYPALVRSLRREFIDVTVYTNGSLIDDDIAEWMLDTNTKIYVNLDYHMRDFQGHDAIKVRERLSELCDKHDGLESLFSISIVMPEDRLDDISNSRSKQQMDFEKSVHHTYNFIPGDSGMSDEQINKEIDRIESGEVKLTNSIFEREIKRFGYTLETKFCLLSCDPSITVGFKGDIFLCHTPASTATSKHTRICSVGEFSMDLYASEVRKQRLTGVCKKDCNMKYLCSGICWANLSHNQFKCDVARKLIPYSLYILANHSNLTPEMLIDMFK